MSRGPHPPTSRVPSPRQIRARRDRWSERDQVYQHFHSKESGWPEARQQAKERDGLQCVICGITEQEQKNRDDLWGAGLHVHHIQAAASFGDPSEAHRLENLATLCSNCHRQADAGDITRDRLRMAIA